MAFGASKKLEDEGIRAVQTALQVSKLEAKSTIGIASGKGASPIVQVNDSVYVGSVGGSSRQEYALVGDTVNSAARLCFLKNNKGIICEETVYSSTIEFFDFVKLEKVKLKGKVNEVQTFSPKSIKVQGNKIRTTRKDSKFFGIEQYSNELASIEVENFHAT